MKTVTFEWDETKALKNAEKHGIRFDYSVQVFRDANHLEFIDEDSHDEERWIAIGLVESYEIFVVYTLRAETVRIISARKAGRHEREIYWNNHFSSPSG